MVRGIFREVEDASAKAMFVASAPNRYDERLLDKKLDSQVLTYTEQSKNSSGRIK